MTQLTAPAVAGGRATAKFERGVCKGYQCQFDHLHGNPSEAASCTPETYRAQQTEAQRLEQESRRRTVMDDPRFDKTIDEIGKRFGLEDEDYCEELLVRNGYDRVIAAFKSFDALDPAGAKKAVDDRRKAEADAKAEKEAAAKASKDKK